MNDRKYIVLSLSDSEDDSSDDELLKPVVGVQPSAAPSELRARTRPDPPSANSSSSNSGSTNNNTTASTDDGVAVAVAATSTKNDAVTTKMSEGSSPLLCTEGDGIEQLILADRVVSCSPPCDNMSVTEEDVPSPAIEDDSNVLVSIVWGNERALRNVPSSSLDKFNGDSDAFASLVHQNAALESEPIRNATPTSHDTPLPSSQTHGHRDEPACVSVSSNNLNATTARSSVGSEDSSGSAGLHEIAQAPTTTTTTCARMKGMGCGKCHGCRTPCCQICRICKLRRGEDTPLSACVFRDCVHLSESVRAYRKTTAERLSKKHRLSTRIDVSSLATQTETAAAVVGNEDAETTTPLSSVALFSDSASSSSSSSSRGSDDYVTRTVGRTTKRAPTLTTGRTGTQCGVCRRCRRKPCGECSFCESNNTALKCVLKCCDGNTREVKLLYGKAVGETLEQEQRHRTISTCMNVYCWWKETEKYYKAIIAKKYLCFGRPYFSVNFMDGSHDRRYRVPENEIMTFFEMELLLESERLDGCGNSLSNSLESSRTQSSTDDEYDIDMDVQRPEPQKRGRPSSPESRDQTADKRKKQQVVQDRKYSSKKVVGARCYARWSRQNFFWGIITKVSGSGSSREFSILFEDGDRMDGVYSHNLYTEKQYMVKYGEKPPQPIKCNWKFVEEEVSQPIHSKCEHALFGKGFCRKWTDVSGLPRKVFGRIAECSDSHDDAKEKLFKIEYDSTFQDLATDMFQGLSFVAPAGNVSEMVAWGGYMTFVEEIYGLDAVLEIQNESTIPFHLKWLLPGMRRVDNQGRLLMEFRGFRLEFEVKPSRINGAGLGMFLTCFNACAAERSVFVLKGGELLGLGPYAPLHRDDRKLYHVFQVKNFIHSYEPGIFVFDANGNDNEMFDVTDDKTGELHEKAAENLLARVNETDGEEVPSVFADNDPYGAVHYYLGHSATEQGDLQIQVGKPFELKVDYGESYEPVRVMKNYSRLKGEKLREMKKSLQMCDEEAVEELSTFSISEMHESLTFLEGLFSPSWETTDTKLQRTLIVALVLHGHVKATQKNIKGTSDSPTQNPVRIFDQIQNENDIVDRAKRMVQTVCCQLGSAEKLKDATLSMDLLAAVVADCVGHCNVESLTANELYEQIFHNL